MSIFVQNDKQTVNILCNCSIKTDAKKFSKISSGCKKTTDNPVMNVGPQRQ